MGKQSLVRWLFFVAPCFLSGFRTAPREELVVAASDRVGRASRADKVRVATQKVMDRLSIKYNASFGFGYVDATGWASNVAGVNHRRTGEPLENYTRIPLGSATKPWTAVLIMQAVERGKVKLTDYAHKWVDVSLTRLYKTTLRALWGAKANNITVGHLLSMQSGLDDYDDGKLEEWTVHHLKDDLDPIKYLESASGKGFHCDPGACVKYSGANYVLLGFVALEVQGGRQWEDLDQRAVIPERLRANGNYNNTEFAKHGPCSHYKMVAHQYNPGKHIDMRRASCLNGWTMGNIMTTGGDMAQFYYDLFGRADSGKGLVSAATLRRMLHFKRMADDDWCFGADEEPGVCEYAMGFERNHLELDIWPMLDASEAGDVALIGHNGQNWGSGASPCGWNPKYRFGMCVTFTSNVALNRSISQEANEDGMEEVACRIYDAVLTSIAGPRLDCSKWDQVTHDESEREYEVKREAHAASKKSQAQKRAKTKRS